jgi:hypothetical protein
MKGWGSKFFSPALMFRIYKATARDLRGLSNNNRPYLTIQTIKSNSLRWPKDVTQGGKILLLNRPATAAPWAKKKLSLTKCTTMRRAK